MKKLIPSSEVVQSVRGDSGEWEVRAGAEADYGESDSQVVLGLESFLRKAPTRRRRDPPGAVAAWQEPRDVHALCREASQAAHAVFASSVRKVRHSIPPLKGST